jgi:hypothetical protein
MPVHRRVRARWMPGSVYRPDRALA